MSQTRELVVSATPSSLVLTPVWHDALANGLKALEGQRLADGRTVTRVVTVQVQGGQIVVSLEID